jgi:MarR family transcriptional regulator, transcriptional regulator for hemolysin
MPLPPRTHSVRNAQYTLALLLEDTRLYVERFDQRARGLGLRLPQCHLLVYLSDHEGMSQIRLAELTDLEPMTLVRSLDRLESSECLERRRDPTDRRARRIHLKARGKRLVDEIWRLVHSTDREAVAGIPRKHGRLMIELLEKIRRNLIQELNVGKLRDYDKAGAETDVVAGREC